jgi:hypothetical protein
MPRKLFIKHNRKRITVAEYENEKRFFKISVINKEVDKSYFDFTFSRYFQYKTIKNDLGYDYVFKTLEDYMTALDITMFCSDYKDTKKYKWIYHYHIYKYNIHI